MNYSSDKNYSNLTGSDWTSIGTGVLGGILTGVSAKAQSDASKRDAETAMKNNQTALELARIQQETAKINLASASSKSASTGSNKNLYIALGVGGVVVLGVVIFAVTRK